MFTYPSWEFNTVFNLDLALQQHLNYKVQNVTNDYKLCFMLPSVIRGGNWYMYLENRKSLKLFIQCQNLRMALICVESQSLNFVSFLESRIF